MKVSMLAKSAAVALAFGLVTSTPAHAVDLSGSGASFPALLIEACKAPFATASGHSFTYAASGSGAAILGGASLNPVALFIGAPIAAILGSQVGHWFGATYGRKLFSRPDGRFFTQSKVDATEKWLSKYGTGKALVLARFIPFVRTLINPLAGIVGIPAKKFIFWNVLGAVVWTQGVIGLGYLLGEKLKGSVDKYLLPVVGLIIVVSVIPVAIEFFREWSTRKHHS